MPIPTKESSQDKASNKVDRVLKQKRKVRPLSEETWDDLNRRGASLADQEAWIVMKRRQLDREANNKV
jgi:hypothetical protein